MDINLMSVCYVQSRNQDEVSIEIGSRGETPQKLTYIFHIYVT